MEYVENLSRLESIVEKLLADLDRIQQDKTALQAALNEKDVENNKLRQELDAIRADRSSIHNRVTSLIDSIEKWETSRSSEETAPEPTSAPDKDKNQGSLFRDSTMAE